MIKLLLYAILVALIMIGGVGIGLMIAYGPWGRDDHD